jgi:hypothetical protein
MNQPRPLGPLLYPLLLILRVPCSLAEDTAPTPPPANASAAQPSITRLNGDALAAAEGEPARFAAEAKWEVAGYNDQEIVYTILITNQDTRIIHCSAELHGYYFENGEKRSIADRQGTTVFPGKQVTVGHWLGMDPNSGATYKVTCRPM